MTLETISPEHDAPHAQIDLAGLFQPITIAGLTLTNRFVMPGMQRGWCVEGQAPQRLADYYAARARGGVQLIMTECVAVDHPSATRTRKYGRLAEDTADGWARCADAIRDAGLRLGLSTHDNMEMDRALSARPSYIALGHVFPTQTKQMPSAPQGLEQLAAHIKTLGDYPTVAIGGISLERVPAVLKTGVGSIAVVSAITQATDWRAATVQLLELVGAGDE